MNELIFISLPPCISLCCAISSDVSFSVFFFFSFDFLRCIWCACHAIRCCYISNRKTITRIDANCNIKCFFSFSEETRPSGNVVGVRCEKARRQIEAHRRQCFSFIYTYFTISFCHFPQHMNERTKHKWKIKTVVEWELGKSEKQNKMHANFCSTQNWILNG